MFLMYKRPNQFQRSRQVPSLVLVVNNLKFGHQVVQLLLVSVLATRWHYLHWLSIWPTVSPSYKFGHQVVPLPLVTMLATKWRILHCHVAYQALFISNFCSFCIAKFLAHQIQAIKVDVYAQCTLYALKHFVVAHERTVKHRYKYILHQILSIIIIINT